MKAIIVITLLVLANQSARAALEGHAIIKFIPKYGIWQSIEISLQQEGNHVSGYSSVGGAIDFELKKDTNYIGSTGGDPSTNLHCTALVCEGAVNGKAVHFRKERKQGHGHVTLESGGTINDGESYCADQFDDGSLKVFSWNSLWLNKMAPGAYVGKAHLGVIQSYEVTVKSDGALTDFLDDPALVAIFLGELITRY